MRNSQEKNTERAFKMENTNKSMQKLKNEKLIELSTEDIKRIQACILDMMKELDEIFQKNNIEYYLGGGSALGSIRHKGFIPWDDDLDIGMPRADYDLLMANAKEWLEVTRADGVKGRRETNTMPQWAGSCWYYIGYLLKDDGKMLDLTDPNVQKMVNSWLPVDLYIGGAEHAVLHLLYSRFWHKVLYDCGIVTSKEPFYKLFNQGMILGEDGVKMSKSRGNVINPDDIVAVSPDTGGVQRTRHFAKSIGCSLAIIDKRRDKHNEAIASHVIGEVKDKICVMFDDMIDTAGTICEASKLLKREGAKDVYVCAVHPVFSGPAIERLANAPIKECIVTNTIPLDMEKMPSNIRQLSVAPLLGAAIARIHDDESVSSLFGFEKEMQVQ